MTARRVLSAETLTVPLKVFQVVGKPCQSVDNLDTHFPEFDRTQKNWKQKFNSQVEYAKSLCASCDVVEQCLQFALDNKIEYGIWGGTTPEERNPKLKRRI